MKQLKMIPYKSGDSHKCFLSPKHFWPSKKETCNHPLVNLMPYRIPFKNREVVDKGIDEMKQMSYAGQSNHANVLL